MEGRGVRVYDQEKEKNISRHPMNSIEPFDVINIRDGDKNLCAIAQNDSRHNGNGHDYGHYAKIDYFLDWAES